LTSADGSLKPHCLSGQEDLYTDRKEIDISCLAADTIYLINEMVDDIYHPTDKQSRLENLSYGI